MCEVLYAPGKLPEKLGRVSVGEVMGELLLDCWPDRGSGVDDERRGA